MAAGTTQEALATKAGLHPTFLSLLERGLRRPSLDVVLRLAHALGVSAAEIVREIETGEVQ